MAASDALPPLVLTVGRAQDNDLVVDHPSVSAHHCRLVLSGGVTKIQDLGSTNGTFVASVRVVDQVLGEGDRVMLGMVPMIFRDGRLHQIETPAPTSLQDLLSRTKHSDVAGSIPAPGGAAASSPTPRNRSRRKATIWFLVAVVPLTFLVGFMIVRADQHRKQDNVRNMLDLVKESEDIMYEWQDEMNAVYSQIEQTCSRSEAECQELLANQVFLEDLQSTARAAATSLETIAGEFQSSRGLRLPSWHKDVVLARNSYLDHNAAWVRYLEAVGRNPGEIFTETVNDDDIDPTWTIACRNFRRIKGSSMYPNLSASNKKRIEEICKDVSHTLAS